MVQCVPVRLIRGSQLNGKYAPNEGYRYDGLYWVTKVFKDDFIENRVVYRFRLVQLDCSYNIPIYSKTIGELVSPLNPIIRRLKRHRKEEDDVVVVVVDDDGENKTRVKNIERVNKKIK